MDQALQLAARPVRDSLKVVISSLNRSEHNGRKNGHMTAAVLYGSENLKIESVDIPSARGGRGAGPRESRPDLRHGSESLEAGISRAHDYAAGGFRARACRIVEDAGIAT